MNAAFLSQWQLYRRGAARPPLVGLEPRTDSAFDEAVKAGEVRVFADTNRPLVALVVEDRRLSGWRIVPVSPFCAPASNREIMVGERVLQLWNATVVSRRFASRSWRVDRISAAELEEVRGAIAAAKPGWISSGEGVQAKYEREFLIGEGTLVPFAAPSAADAPRFAWLAPALNKAISTPPKESSVNFSTFTSSPLNFKVLPTERSEARSFRFLTGKLRFSSVFSISTPTAPVAPTTATLNDFAMMAFPSF